MKCVLSYAFFWRLGRMIFAVRIRMVTERRTVKNSVIRIVSGRPIVCPNLPSASPIPVNDLELYPVGIAFCHSFPIVYKIQNSNLHVFKRSQYHNLFNIYFFRCLRTTEWSKMCGEKRLFTMWFHTIMQYGRRYRVWDGMMLFSF